MTETTVFGSFGRYAEIALADMTSEQHVAYDQTVQARGQVPGPYKIWLQNHRLETAMVPVGAYYQNGTVLSPAEREIVTNLINGHWAAAGYSNYEHELIGQEAGLAAQDVAALIAGLPVTFVDPRRQIVHDVAKTLIAGHRLPQALFDKAIELIGHPGLTDVTVLIGYFTSVSLTLVAYDVPSDAAGLDRKAGQ